MRAARLERLGVDTSLGHGHVGDFDAILVRLEPHVVADADLGQNHAHLGGQVLPHALDAFQQVAAALADRPRRIRPTPSSNSIGSTAR